jgi:4-amino-4-deoxy-L-arabinose transferase-like glycosyltransferase
MNCLSHRLFCGKSENTLSWFLLSAIIVISAFYLAIHYRPFILPNVDYLRIRELAAELVSGQLPGRFKGMPLVSIIVGLIGLVMPASHDPYLYAALALNIAFSLGNLVLIYLVAREFLGGLLALIPVIVLLAAPEFTRSAHQPLLEPAIGFLTLATLVALSRNSRWVFVFAGLCALTRYEMAVIFPIVFFIEVYRNPKEWVRYSVYSMAAALPFALWFGFSMLKHAGGNPYLQEMKGMGFTANWQVLWTMHRPLPGPRLIVLGIACLSWLVGLPIALRRNAVLTLAITSFFALYTLSHIIFGIDRERYAYPVLWVIPLLMTVVIHAIFLRMKELANRLPYITQIIGIIILAIFLLGWIAMNLRMFGSYPDSTVAPAGWYAGWILLLFLSLGSVTMMAGAPPMRFGAIACMVALGFASIFFIRSGNELARSASSIYFDKAEYVVVAKWLAKNLPKGSRAVVPLYSEIVYSDSAISPQQLVLFSDLTAENHKQLIKELDTAGINHAVFIYRHELPANPRANNYYRNLYYYNKLKVYLMDPFRHGQQVEGFELVASLPPPNPKFNSYSYVYRRSTHPTTLREVDND